MELNMKKWFSILIVLAIVLAIDCIAMRHRISVQEDIIRTQKEAIQREHETHRMYERRCDSLFNELNKKDDEDKD
jgi:hypothetical protein